MAAKHHVSVRLDSRTITRVDALLSHVEVGGRSATRSDVLRVLIQSALGRHEPAKSGEVHEVGADSPIPKAPKCAG